MYTPCPECRQLHNPAQVHKCPEPATIWLEYLNGGGWNRSFVFQVEGGPDDGKQVTLYPTCPADALEYGASQYNGSAEEWDETMGFLARPCFQVSGDGAIHGDTLSVVRNRLTSLASDLHADPASAIEFFARARDRNKTQAKETTTDRLERMCSAIRARYRRLV